MNVLVNDNPDLLPIGTKVFIPNEQQETVSESEIIGYRALIRKNTEEHVAVVTDYELRKFNLRPSHDSFDCFWKFQEFFLNYEEAKKAAKFYPVSAIDQEWFVAIGVDSSGKRVRDGEALDECELSICCSTISSIRDILIGVMRNEGIGGTDRLILVDLLQTHERSEPMPVLDRILSQMGIEWKNDEVLLDGIKINQNNETETE